MWDAAWLGEACDLEALRPAGLSWDDKLPVPGCFDCLPDYAGRRGTMAYRTRLRATPGTTGLLRFGGLGLWGAVYVDGRRLHVCDLPYSGFDVVAPTSAEAERELVVVVDNRYDDARTPLIRPGYDFYGYGGIYRPVTWYEVGESWIERVRIETLSLAPPRIRARVRFGGRAPRACALTTCFDGGDRESRHEVGVEDGLAVLELDVPGGRPWSPASPSLHVLTVSDGGDTVAERFGLRTVRRKGREILLNGEPLKLLGFCRHEAHPQFGPALPPALMIHDLRLLREMGCNFVRGSHYPQDQRFLDCCDELGFLVWEESLGWGYYEEQWEAPSFLDANLRQARAMVRRSFNHPCVILWGFLNEGYSHELRYEHIYRGIAGAIREEDAGRLVTYATNRFHEESGDALLELADVVGVNAYPGWYARRLRGKSRPLAEIVPFLREVHERIDALGQGEKPLIISEIGAGAIHGWRDAHRAHWSEEYQRDLLDVVCREVVEHERYAGVSLWQFCDSRTFDTSQALLRPRAFNNKGVVDEYRRPKLAFERVKRIFRALGSALKNKDCNL